MYFSGCRVLDLGSLDINGSNKHLFKDCDYTGLDIAEGKNVDIVCLTHEHKAPDEHYKTIISGEMLEHDMFYKESLINIVRMLEDGGLFVFTCATTGRPEHGTMRTDGGVNSPMTVKYKEWENYYKNITEEDVRDVVDIDSTFSEYEFSTNNRTHDLYFWGIK